jgi:protein subunit release factor B
MAKRELLFSVTLKDCTVQTFTAGGPGGQHQNTSNTAVRIIHRASGATGESREHRSQLQNKKAAFRRMAESKKFQTWVNKQAWGNPEPPEKRVEKDMDPSNLLIMARADGKWKIID